jgi:hypothetical protein
VLAGPPGAGFAVFSGIDRPPLDLDPAQGAYVGGCGVQLFSGRPGTPVEAANGNNLVAHGIEPLQADPELLELVRGGFDHFFPHRVGAAMRATEPKPGHVGLDPLHFRMKRRAERIEVATRSGLLEALDEQGVGFEAHRLCPR